MKTTPVKAEVTPVDITIRVHVRHLGPTALADAMNRLKEQMDGGRGAKSSGGPGWTWERQGNDRARVVVAPKPLRKPPRKWLGRVDNSKVDIWLAEGRKVVSMVFGRLGVVKHVGAAAGGRVPTTFSVGTTNRRRGVTSFDHDQNLWAYLQDGTVYITSEKPRGAK